MWRVGGVVVGGFVVAHPALSVTHMRACSLSSLLVFVFSNSTAPDMAAGCIVGDVLPEKR